MSAGDGLRLFMIAIGVAVLIAVTISLARKHMTEFFCIAWGAGAVAVICAGIFLKPYRWNEFVSWQGLNLILFGVILMLVGAFIVSIRISQLDREVKELAIRVSLLEQENAMLLGERTEETVTNGT